MINACTTERFSGGKKPFSFVFFSLHSNKSDQMVRLCKLLPQNFIKLRYRSQLWSSWCHTANVCTYILYQSPVICFFFYLRQIWKLNALENSTPSGVEQKIEYGYDLIFMMVNAWNSIKSLREFKNKQRFLLCRHRSS